MEHRADVRVLYYRSITPPEVDLEVAVAEETVAAVADSHRGAAVVDSHREVGIAVDVVSCQSRAA